VTEYPAQAQDQAELLGLVSAYARCVDRRDYAGLAGLFAPGSRVGKFEGPLGQLGSGYWRDGGEPFATSVRANHARYLVTTHHLGQHTTRIDADSADGETYCLAHHVYEQDGRRLNRVMAIRYLDDYSRSPAGWLFAERRLYVDWTEYRDMGSADGRRPT
jgi:hypothetical protein